MYYGPGILLKGNAERVKRTVRHIRELGMEPATPDEAREMLNIPKLS